MYSYPRESSKAGADLIQRDCENDCVPNPFFIAIISIIGYLAPASISILPHGAEQVDPMHAIDAKKQRTRAYLFGILLYLAQALCAGARAKRSSKRRGSSL